MKYHLSMDDNIKDQQQQNDIEARENNFLLETQADQKMKSYQFNDIFLDKNISEQDDNPFDLFSDGESINFNKSFDFEVINPLKKTYKEQEQENIQQKAKEIQTEVQKQNKKKEQTKKEVSCKCQSSNCLRLHCSCFKTLGFCSDSCKCKNCLNKKEFKQARQFVIQKTKKIYKKAFEQKSYEIRGIKINKQGCNCKRHCQSQYCGCKKINGQCSPICRCVSCYNNKINLSKDEIQNFYKPCSRKKDKIIINFKKNLKSKNVQVNKNIIYQAYQKNRA